MYKRILPVLLICVALIIALTLSTLGASADAPLVWRTVAEDAILNTGTREIIPQRYRTITTDQAVLRQLLASAPLEYSQDAAQRSVILPLPLPDGTVGRFRIVASPIVAPELAKKFPEITTYSAQGIDNPAATARLDLGPAGFHALILNGDDQIYIDPYSREHPQYSISYFASDFTPDQDKALERSLGEQVLGDSTAPAPHASQLQPSGPILRTYRLALAATGEYTAFHGGTVAGAQAAIVTSVNRVNAVYEAEVAVRLILIANNNLIVYTNAATDPYTNNSGSTMLGQNQSNLTTVIGAANYDIGHVFSTGGGGVATLNSPCNDSTKARGVTGSSSPVGDPFDIDYVAHEIGHQFGGRHTFNGTTGSCGGGNRSSVAAYEPGSGSTIMAYAGICGAENLQPNSDPYFHAKSYEEIIAFTTTGGGNACAVQVNTGNQAPTVDAGPTYTIPNRTPFTLTGSGSDPDGDALTYAWEQYDLGTAAPPNTDDSTRPIFRTFNPTSSPARTFPKLSDILNNTTTFGESLPTTNRTLRFRLTARDNRAGGGGVNVDETTLTVDANSGPFQVTAPNTAVSWTGTSSQTVTWNVANTTEAPVNCPSVNILLSTDGGQTFPTTLVGATPNDGSQAITVPNTPSTTARVKIICANNIFFDISNTNFTITLGGGPTDTPTATQTASPTATEVTPSSTPTVTGTQSPTPTATPILGSCALEEGFDNVASLPGAGWNLQNLSNPLGTSGWGVGNGAVFSAHSGASTSYIAANYQSTGATGTISTWLLTPVQNLANGNIVSFWTRIPSGTELPDRLEVRLSTNGSSTNVGANESSVGDFTTVLLTINPTLTTGVYPKEWTQFTATISGLGAPDTGRIGFRYFVTDAGLNGTNSNYVGIDDAKFCAGGPTTTPTATATATRTATATTGPGTPTATTGIGANKIYAPVIIR